MFIFELEKTNLDLSKTEAEFLLNINLKCLKDNFFITSQKFNLNQIKRLAYTKNIFKYLDENINFSKIKLNLIKNTYKLEIKSFTKKTLDKKELVNYIYNNLEKPKVDVKNPNHIYYIFYFKSKFYLFEKIYENIDEPSKRRAHLRQFNHPTSLNPKQAKAMINLSKAKKEILDCFCGMGGILLEASLMNLNVKASDISEYMINKAKINLKDFKKIKFQVQDATKLKIKSEAIVTDLPFGKNSFVSENLNELFTKFFVNAQNLTSSLVVGHSSNLNIKKLIKNTSWKILKEFSIYVHKSMTRKITILIKN
ncbi:MAG: TRM11 family methyltransferase [Candidatus Woesearchaeota archaeon]